MHTTTIFYSVFSLLTSVNPLKSSPLDDAPSVANKIFNIYGAGEKLMIQFLETASLEISSGLPSSDAILQEARNLYYEWALNDQFGQLDDDCTFDVTDSERGQSPNLTHSCLESIRERTCTQNASEPVLATRPSDESALSMVTTPSNLDNTPSSSNVMESDGFSQKPHLTSTKSQSIFTRMRLSVPNIPLNIINAVGKTQQVPFQTATERIVNFLTPGNTTVLTGAGVSVDSGIRAYRGKDGRYMNPNYKPIFFQDLVENSPKGHSFRQRYWSRAYMGYQPIYRAQPNPTHYALAALLYTTFIKDIITQNVDGLHSKASSLPLEEEDPQILQLHGSLHKVHCQKYHFESRARYQHAISIANPKWKLLADDLENSRIQLRTNPDGDIELPGIRFDDFQIPPCEVCLKEGVIETTMKPSVVFFGESLSDSVRDNSFSRIESCDQLLVIGTTLATYSAFRLVKRALELKKPVLLLNYGPTRADNLPGIEKIEVHSSQVLHAAAELLTAGIADEEVDRMLSSGAITPIPPE